MNKYQIKMNGKTYRHNKAGKEDAMPPRKTIGHARSLAWKHGLAIQSEAYGKTGRTHCLFDASTGAFYGCRHSSSAIYNLISAVIKEGKDHEK